MRLVTMREMLKDARAGHYAVGAFEFWSYDSAWAVANAAKSLGVPAILQVGPFEKDYMDGYKHAVKLAEMVSDQFDLPIAIHLDHAETYEEVCEALEAGFTSVMIDASKYDYDTNVAMTRQVVEKAREYGASVEAEIGKLGGSEGNIKNEEDEQTDPQNALDFVNDTGVDCLAVAIGTAHGFYTKPPKINIDRLEKIAALVDIPLVLHGGSGTPEDKVADACERGIAKVNICTEFIAAFGKGFDDQNTVEGYKYNVNTLFRAGRDSGSALAKHKMELFLSRRK
ncbi:MAG: class II fructose-bisphosphate aldolase [Clostridia bacterium]|nr:class II fructose-bisphosphate aldolase [Clostridia bacterium]